MSRSRLLRHCLTASFLFAAGLVTAGAARADAPLMLARLPAEAPTEIDVYFPPQHLSALEALTTAQVWPLSPEYHHWLTPQSFAAQFGAAPAAVAAVAAELRDAGFTVTGRSALGLHLLGTVGAVERTFRTEIATGRFSDGSEAPVARQTLTLPASLVAAGAHVPQFIPLPLRQRHSQMQPAAAKPPNFRSTVGPYFTDDLRQAYDFPSATKLNGVGIGIGILMSNDYEPFDMDIYWADQGISALAPGLVPRVSSVPVGGGAAFDSQQSGETHLDIQQSGGMALGATVILYNLRDLSDGQILAGLTQILEANKVAVVNMSFGAPEEDYFAVGTRWLLDVQHQLFLQGNAMGITFVASSGDNGGDANALVCSAGHCVSRPVVSPSSPASDPNVTAVGGTNLVTRFSPPSIDSAYVRENANFDPLTGPGRGPRWGSGGGISAHFAKPAYQTLVPTPSARFRTVPDLALHMGGCQQGFSGFGVCPADRSSDWEAIGGQEVQVIGTSAAAPDIAGLFALKAKLTKGHRLGNMNPYIYAQAKAQALHKLTAFRHTAIPGDNGPFRTNPAVAFDAVIGNGTVLGRAFLGVPTLPSAGTPGTQANP